MPKTTHRTCPTCATPLAADAHFNAKFCGVACRNRWNNGLAKTREVQLDEHGRRVGYARGCRCDDCMAFNASESRRRRAAEPKKPPAPPRQRKGIKLGRRNPDEHGTSSAYAYGCRCQPCKAARSAQNAEWAKRNPEKFKATQDRYRRRNPRPNRKSFAPFDREAMEYVRLIRHDPCVYCGGESGSVDHVDPVSVSRSSAWDNLAPACRSCNSSKGAKDLLGFLLYRCAIADMEVAQTA